MTRKADLIALRDAVQVGPVSAHTASKCFPNGYAHIVNASAYPGAVDAALAFFAAVLPGWFWTRQGFVMTVTDDHTGWGSKPHYSARDDQNPARALLIATLNALIDEAVT